MVLTDPVQILQALIRYNTTNPPGNERECIEWIAGQLREAGIEPVMPARAAERPCLVARIHGEGSAPPLMMYGHVDVVTTEGQKWQVPPFEGRIQDGFVWGRGALDMKGPVAMFLAAFLRAKLENNRLPGDVILALVPDEEAGSEDGAMFLVDQHPDLFAGVKYALGEFGGFNLSFAGKRTYPIMVSEKQTCWMKMTVRGEGGHGSIPLRGQAAAKLGQALLLIDKHRLPVHITPPVRLMIEHLSNGLGGPTGAALRALLNPRLTDFLLGRLGPRGAMIAPLLHNTVSPTMFHGSEKINVIPSEISVGLDGRLVPGAKPEQLITELRALVGDEFEFEAQPQIPGPEAVDMGLFDALAAVLRELDPEGIPFPFVLMGVTDARCFARLGIQTYGFTPLKLPEDFNFLRTVHAADERVPVEALRFGVQAISRALEVFH